MDFEHPAEGRLITAEYEKFYLLAVYVPNSGDKLKRLGYRINNWEYTFRNYIQRLNMEKPVYVIYIYIQIIICGDLNCSHKEIDLSNPKANIRSAGFTIEERYAFQMLLNLGYVDTFRELHPNTIKYSYWSYRGDARINNIGWRLDYIITSTELFKCFIFSDISVQYLGSDHAPVKAIIDLNCI